MMATKKVFTLALATSMLVGSFSEIPDAFAHHGWGSYKESIEIALTVKELKLGNPHDRLIATDSNGQDWNLLMAPPARNRRYGFDGSVISVGQEIDLIGQRHPTRHEIKVHCLFSDGEAIYTYRYNGGISSLKRYGREERC